jgi:hypothetical protein
MANDTTGFIWPPLTPAVRKIIRARTAPVITDEPPLATIVRIRSKVPKNSDINCIAKLIIQN